MVLKGTGRRLSNFTGYIRSPEFVAVAAAIVITPIVAGFILPLIRRIPVIGSRPVFALVAAAFIMFLIGATIGGGMYVKAIFIGLAGGFLINAFTSTGFGQNLIGRFTSSVRAVAG